MHGGIWVLEAWCEGGHQTEKTPCRSYSSGGGVSDAPSGHLPTRRAYEHGGVSIAALLIARTTAIRIVLPGSPGASHLLLICIYVSQPRGCQEAQPDRQTVGQTPFGRSPWYGSLVDVAPLTCLHEQALFPLAGAPGVIAGKFTVSVPLGPSSPSIHGHELVIAALMRSALPWSPGSAVPRFCQSPTASQWPTY
jgi:hypothetical protein